MSNTKFLFIIVMLNIFLFSGIYSQSNIVFEKPVLITSAGQSADITLASMLCKKINLDHKAISTAKESDLSGIKTLIIVAGYSSKGLGAAGVSREDELKRIKSLISAAKNNKINIIMMHLGGKPRRGNQSDEFNKLAAEAANYMIVVKQGDEDKFFSKIAENKKVKIDLIEKIADGVNPLKSIFNLN